MLEKERKKREGKEIVIDLTRTKPLLLLGQTDCKESFRTDK